jgi:hypothetical protein
MQANLNHPPPQTIVHIMVIRARSHCIFLPGKLIFVVFNGAMTMGHRFMHPNYIGPCLIGPYGLGPLI